MSNIDEQNVAYIVEHSELTREEAEALLSKCGGSLFRAMTDIESRSNPAMQAEPAAEVPAEPAKPAKDSNINKLTDLLTTAYRSRLKLRRGDTDILNVSALTGIVALLSAPYLCVLGAAVSLILNYRFSFVKNDPAFSAAEVKAAVRGTADTVKDTMEEITEKLHNRH